MQVLINATDDGILRCITAHYYKMAYSDIFTKKMPHSAILSVSGASYSNSSINDIIE